MRYKIYAPTLGVTYYEWVMLYKSYPSTVAVTSDGWVKLYKSSVTHLLVDVFIYEPLLRGHVIMYDCIKVYYIEHAV
jgi:hypothetical protein